MRQPPRFLPFLELLEARDVPSIYHVAPNGSDGNSGAENSPWRTLQHAADLVKAGDTVIVRAGTYAGFELWTDGTAHAPIVFRAEEGVVINKPNKGTPDGINLEGADYVTIEGFTVTGVAGAGIRSVMNHHVTIRDNFLDGNGTWGIFAGFSDDLLIEGNVVSRSQRGDGIHVSDSGDRPVIRDNEIWGNRAGGILLDGGREVGDVVQKHLTRLTKDFVKDVRGGKLLTALTNLADALTDFAHKLLRWDGVISDAVVESNVVHDNGPGGGWALGADGVWDSLFQNNLLHDNHAGGIGLYQKGGSAGSRNNVVVNNTVVMAQDGDWALQIKDRSTGNKVFNNILLAQNSKRGSISVSTDSLRGFESDYNVVTGQFENGGKKLNSLAKWQSGTGQDLHSAVATADQLFADPAAGDYHLSADSVAIDMGTSLYAPAADLEGTARPQQGGFDVGAFEALEEVEVPPQEADLGELRVQYGFSATDAFQENQFGFGEKWFQDRNGVLFNIIADGAIHQWQGVHFNLGTLVARVNASVHADPHLLFNAPVELTPEERGLLDSLRTEHGFHFTGNYNFNWGGLGDKWFLDHQGAWHFILTTGGIYRWDGNSNLLTSTLVATVNPLAYDDPDLLFAIDATTDEALSQLQEQFGFHHSGDYSENWGGLGEKWFFDRHNAWFFITPSGKIYRWNGQNDLRTSPAVAVVNPAVHQDPTILFNA